MVRKALMVMLAFVMMVGTLVTSFPMGIAYAENYIDFDNQQLNNSTLTNPYEYNSAKVDMNATLNNVDGASINYTVEQIVDPNTKPPRVDQKTTSTRAGILVNGSKMTIVGLRLFAGLNRITFTGNSGGATVTQTIYVSYIDAPTVTNLTIFGGGGGKELRIKDKTDTIVTPDYVSNLANGTIFIRGTAPNVSQVTVNVIDVTSGQKKGVTVSVSSNDSSFITSGLNLNHGKNKLQFILQNNDQYSETYRDVVYYNGSVTFYNEQLSILKDLDGDGNYDNDLNNDGTVDAGEAGSEDPRSVVAGKPVGSDFSILRKGEPFFVETALVSKVRMTGKVIVPNNYNSDQDPLRVTAVYMKAKDYNASGQYDKNVDEKEQVVIEFNKSVVTSNSRYEAEDINDMLRFFYVKDEDPSVPTVGNVLEIPALDEEDPDSNNTSYGDWDTANKTFTITLGAADVQKFRGAWSNTSSTPSSITVNKPFILFRENLDAQDGSPGIGAGLLLDDNPSSADELVMRNIVDNGVALGDVLLVGPQGQASAPTAIPLASTSKRWVISNMPLSSGGSYGQIAVIGDPTLTIPENALIVDTEQYTDPQLTTLQEGGSNLLVANAPSPDTENAYQVIVRRTDNGVIAAASNFGLAKGDLVRFGTVYGIVAQNPTNATIKIYTPNPSAITPGTVVEEVNGFTEKVLNTSKGLGDNSGRTIGTQKINSTFDSVTRANSKLSINVGTFGSVSRFDAAPTPTIYAGDLIKVDSEYAIVGLPYASIDGTTRTKLGDGAANTTISMIPVIGLSGDVLGKDKQVQKVTYSGLDDFGLGTPPTVDGTQRVGMDGKIRLKINGGNFTATELIKRGDLIALGTAPDTVYAIATQDITNTTSVLNLIAPPGAEITDTTTVNEINAETLTNISFVKEQLGLGAPGNLSTTGGVSFSPGNLGYFAAGSFDSTKPSIIKSKIVANTLGSYKVDEGESIEVYFQDPKGDLLRSPSSVNSDILVEGKYFDQGLNVKRGNRATLDNVGLKTTLSWPGNPGNNPMMKVAIETRGESFFEDYGYISLFGQYPLGNAAPGSTIPVNNLPITGELDASNVDTRYSMVLLGNTFDGDNRSPNPDINNLVGSVLDQNFFATDDNGVVPNYTAEVKFRDPATRAVLKTMNNVQLRVVKGENYSETNPYFTFQFDFDLPPEARALHSKKYGVEIRALNTTLSPIDYEGTNEGELIYSLEQPNKPLLHDINFLAKPDAGTINQSYLLSLGQVANKPKFSRLVDNTSIYSTPFAIEYTVIDPNKDDLPDLTGEFNIKSNARDYDLSITSTSPSGDSVNLTDYNSSSGKNSNVYKYLETYVSGPDDVKAVDDKFKTTTDVTGDNVDDDIKRFVLMIKELPFSGTQTLKFTFTYKDTVSSKTYTYSIERVVNYVSGPYVAFDTMYDGQVINRDTTEDKNFLVREIVEKALGKLRGELRNVDLKDKTVFERGNPNQKLYLYVNNVEVALKQESLTKPNRFNVDEGKTSYEAIYDQIKSGENKILFLYKSNGPNSTEKDIYKKELIIRVSSTNIPELPVQEKGMYPYPIEFTKPKKDSKRFPGQDETYSTEEKKLNVYGSFDFIDLGTNRTMIESKLFSLQSGSTSLASNYILEIKRNDGVTWAWDLTKRFSDDSGYTYNSGSNITPSGLNVTYVKATQNFEFVISNQEMPKDGTKLVYSIRVYNGGYAGPYATKSLEITSKVMPYTILRPTKQELAGSINRNYVEIVLEAKGADSVMVDKVQAKQIDFDDDNDGDKEYKDVFRAVIMNLKPNKKNTVKFTITKGTDKTTGQIDIMYAQDMIPGAQWMEPMKASHRIFNNAVELTFPKDTYLRRMDPKSPNKYKTQVYADHTLLFGIANPEDGVVDRYDYQKVPSSFRTDVSLGKQLLQASFDDHFIQVSPMYWIDGGQADNPDTTDIYDDVKEGFLPHQLPSTDLPNFNKRQDDLMVVPTQRGKIKLSYDKNVVADASMWLTVYRFDPDDKTWTNVGGVVDPTKRQITANFDRFGYYVVGKLANSFTDVSLHKYARNHAEAMYVKGVLKPLEDNEFGMDVNITRGEFAAMIVRALQVPLNFDPDNLNFDDVPLATNANSLYDYRYIETAANMGILRGTTPRVFEPEKPITREDASVILTRALQLKQDTDPAKVTKDLQKLFKDYNLISSYSRSAVLAIAKKKYVNGSPIDEKDPKKGYIFEPSAYLLRGDASIIMANIMKDLKTLPAIQAVR